MKLCNVCNLEKSIDEFYIKDKKSGRLSSSCKSCDKIKVINNYFSKHDHYKQYDAGRNSRKLLEIKNFIHTTKSCGCSICGYNKCREALEFHHINDDKEFTISNYVHRYDASLQLLKSEVEKCIVLCANCHRKLHWG